MYLKKILIKSIITFIFLLITINLSFAQEDRFIKLNGYLEVLSADVPGLNEKIDLSVNGVSIQEVIRGIGMSNKVNLNIDPSININIVTNFNDVPVRDVLIFLCKKYDLDITFTGNILSIVKYSQPVTAKTVIAPPSRKLNIQYDSLNDLLTLDLKNDTLFSISKLITNLSGKNIIVMPEVKDKQVNFYINKMPFSNALSKMAMANNIKLSLTPDSIFLFEKNDPKPIVENIDEDSGKNNHDKKNHYKKKSNNIGSNSKNNFEFSSEDGKTITVHAINTPITDIIKNVAAELNINYYLLSEIKESISLSCNDLPFNDFLTKLLNGTNYTYRIDDSIYIIGDRMMESLRKTQVIQLQNRTVLDISKHIPADLKKGVEIKEFPELNSIIVSGSSPMIREIQQFIKDIDKIVPVVSIEILIIDYKTGYSISTGVKAGIGTSAKKDNITILPNPQLELGASTINNLINSFNGWGLINLGKVTPNFYLSINALENDNILKVRSTPKLSTLNGHEAKLSIGTTQYYLEESNNVIGSQNPQNIITHQYKSVRADMALTINPIVSGDDQITLEIKVDQSDFTSRISPDAPPGQVSRNFSSVIRVKNQEMVLLGGLESNSNSVTGSGIPVLNRIPVLRWLFSTKTKEKSKSKLNIFIKPVIMYQ